MLWINRDSLMAGAVIMIPEKTDPATLQRSYTMFDPTARHHGGALSYYHSPDAFLAQLSSRKRKAIRKERAGALAFGGTIRTLTGDELQPEHWDAFWRARDKAVAPGAASRTA